MPTNIEDEEKKELGGYKHSIWISAQVSINVTLLLREHLANFGVYVDSRYVICHWFDEAISEGGVEVSRILL